MTRFKVEVVTSISSAHRFTYELFAMNIMHAAQLCRHWHGVRVTRWPL